MQKSPRTSARPGFTLVELLMVVGIIVLLAAVLVVAIGQAGIKAREQATVAIIKKVSNQVQERLEAFDRLKSQPQFASEAQTFASMNSISTNQARILLLKNAMKKFFPQSFAELSAQDSAEYTRMTAVYNPSPHNTETESSALLYYMLTQGKGLGIPTMNPGDFNSSEVADTDGDGLLEFIDAWGKPLRFYRWPTRLFATGAFDSSTPPLPVIDRSRGATLLFNGLPANDADLKKDPDDPTLLLYDSSSTSYITTNYTEANYHTARTYHHFLIVSSGADGQKIADPDKAFGLYSPTNTNSATPGYLAEPTGNFDALTDNITNRNR